MTLKPLAGLLLAVFVLLGVARLEVFLADAEDETVRVLPDEYGLVNFFAAEARVDGLFDCLAGGSALPEVELLLQVELAEGDAAHVHFAEVCLFYRVADLLVMKDLEIIRNFRPDVCGSQ